MIRPALTTILHWLLPDPRVADLRRALHTKSLTLSLLEGEAEKLRQEILWHKEDMAETATALEAARDERDGLHGEAATARRDRDQAQAELAQIRRRLLELADDLEANGLPAGAKIAHLVLASKLRGLVE